MRTEVDIDLRFRVSVSLADLVLFCSDPSPLLSLHSDRSQDVVGLEEVSMDRSSDSLRQLSIELPHSRRDIDMSEENGRTSISHLQLSMNEASQSIHTRCPKADAGP